jgi:hypothetical protein
MRGESQVPISARNWVPRQSAPYFELRTAYAVENLWSGNPLGFRVREGGVEKNADS